MRTMILAGSKGFYKPINHPQVNDKRAFTVNIDTHIEAEFLPVIYDDECVGVKVRMCDVTLTNPVYADY